MVRHDKDICLQPFTCLLQQAFFRPGFDITGQQKSLTIRCLDAQYAGGVISPPLPAGRRVKDAK